MFASDRRLRSIGKASALWIPVSPRAAALAIVDDRFGDRWEAEDRDRDRPVFRLADFQKDAVRRAERILALRRGVLIADSVGLGKSFVALGLIEGALRRGERIAVATPAALRRDWVPRLRRLCSALEVDATWGLGGGSAVDARSRSGQRFGDIAGNFLGWISHARLSRGTFPADRLTMLDLVIVDEAHAFRNPRTRRYRALAELCRTARVVLITATPVNNTLWDLYFQLRLFAGDGAFRDLGVPDLADAVRSVAAADGGTVRGSADLRRVLRAVTIRRTRATLRARDSGSVGSPPVGSGRAGFRPVDSHPVVSHSTDSHPVGSHLAGSHQIGSHPAGFTEAIPAAPTFPQRAPPVPVRYAFRDTYPIFHRDVIDLVEALRFAPFRLSDYGAPRDQGGNGTAEALIRLGLLKRLESSVAAFRSSISRHIRYLEAFLSSLDEGYLRTPTDHRSLDPGGDDDVVQLVLEAVTLRPAPPGLDVQRLRADVENDRKRLWEIRSALVNIGHTADPKLARFRELLDGELRGEKIVVFTEFRETARYLWRSLLPRGSVGLVDGGGAFLGAAPAGRSTVISRFAPKAQGCPPPVSRERVDLLIATDVLAEGVNLQDACRIVCYDLPWNPVRVIQRIGRVDRLGSSFDVVFSYHFLPDEGLDRVLRLHARLQRKLAAIRRTVGTDGPVLGTGRNDPGALVERLAVGDPGALDAIDELRESRSDAMERLRAAVRRLGPGPGEAGVPAGRPPVGRPPVDSPSVDPPAVDPPPPATRALAAALTGTAGAEAVRGGTVGTDRRVLLAYRVGGRVQWLLFDASRDAIGEDDDLCADLLRAAIDAPADAAHPIDRVVVARAITAGRRWLAERSMVSHAADALPPHSPGARAARRLLNALAAVPGGPDPDLCRRTDIVLAALARRRDAGTEARIHATIGAVAARTDFADPARRAEFLLERLENAIRFGPVDRRPAEGVEAPAEAEAKLVGILDFRPESD